LPGTKGAEDGQCDTPQSRWISVHDDGGGVLAGVRLTPTTARCGIYSYMIRDAQNGLLESIPANLLDTPAPVQEGIWEVTRGFVASGIRSNIRKEVRTNSVLQMLRTSREEGIRTMLPLLPSNWARWASRCQLAMKAAGPKLNQDGTDYQAVWIDFSTQLH